MTGHIRIRVRRPGWVPANVALVPGSSTIAGYAAGPADAEGRVLIQPWPAVRSMPSWSDVEVHAVDEVDGHETVLHGVQAISLNLVEGTDAIVATLRVYEPEVDVEAWALFQDHEALLMVERLVEEIELGGPVPSKLLTLARELLEKRQRNAPPER